MDRDGARSADPASAGSACRAKARRYSRRGTGEGLLPSPRELSLPRSIRAAAVSLCTFQPNASANCGAAKLTSNDRRGACRAAAS